MAFGMKSRTLNTSGSYTLEEFYEKIKNVNFAAGKPSYEKYGPAFIIIFPEVDRHNQVQIISNAIGGKKPSSKFTIQRAEALGLKGSLVNDALDMLTGGLFRASGMVGNNTKRCEELVDETYNQLEALGL